MLQRHPLADAAETDSDDLELVRRIQNGDREALESLVRHHQDWIYNIALRMVYLPEDAEDATQEILIKLLTKLSSFEGRSSFRTWLYRLVCNHVLNMKRGRADKAEWTFSKYRRELERTPDLTGASGSALGARTCAASRRRSPHRLHLRHSNMPEASAGSYRGSSPAARRRRCPRRRRSRRGCK